MDTWLIDLNKHELGSRTCIDSMIVGKSLIWMVPIPKAHGPDVTRKEFCEKHMVDRGHSESCSHQDGDDDDQRNPTKVVE